MIKRVAAQRQTEVNEVLSPHPSPRSLMDPIVPPDYQEFGMPVSNDELEQNVVIRFQQTMESCCLVTNPNYWET